MKYFRFKFYSCMTVDINLLGNCSLRFKKGQRKRKAICSRLKEGPFLNFKDIWYRIFDAIEQLAENNMKTSWEFPKKNTRRQVVNKSDLKVSSIMPLSIASLIKYT